MADLTGLEDAIRRRADEIFTSAVGDADEQLVKATPVGETGQLRDSASVRALVSSGDVLVAEAQWDKDYAEAVDKGARPHVIVPRRARVLRFEVGGTVVFARRVNHPGNPPGNQFTDTVQRWSQILREAQ